MVSLSTGVLSKCLRQWRTRGQRTHTCIITATNHVFRKSWIVISFSVFRFFDFFLGEQNNCFFSFCHFNFPYSFVIVIILAGGGFLFGTRPCIRKLSRCIPFCVTSDITKRMLSCNGAHTSCDLKTVIPAISKHVHILARVLTSFWSRGGRVGESVKSWKCRHEVRRSNPTLGVSFGFKLP